MAALTGLAERGPAAGCAVVFPDGFRHVWNDRRDAPRLARRQRIDDVAFLQALVEHLRRSRLNEGTHVYAVGMSNGGFLAEHLARHGLMDRWDAEVDVEPDPTPLRLQGLARTLAL